MATVIRIGVEGGAIAKINDARQNVKQLAAEVKDAQRDIQGLARAGQTVNRQVSENYKSIRKQYEDAKQIAKEQSKLEKAAEEQGKNFTRGDVRKAMALKELAEGNVSTHSLRHATELLADTDIGKRLGLGRFADTLANISGPLIIGNMVKDFVIRQYEQETERIQRTAQIESTSIDKAREAGMSGNIRKQIEEKVFSAAHAKHRMQREIVWFGEGTGRFENTEAHDAETNRRYQEENAKEAEKVMSEVNEARKFSEEFGVTRSAIILQASKNKKDNRAITNEDWNEALDQIMTRMITSESGQKILREHNDRIRREREEKLQERRHEEADPVYRAAHKFMEHETKMRAELDMQVRHKRYANPNPVDF